MILHKKCLQCHKSLTINKFYSDKSRADGKANKCTSCHKAYNAQYVKHNRQKVNKARRSYIGQYIQNNLQDWKMYFELIYGTYPSCNICSKTLTFNEGSGNDRVCFDHRHADNERIAGAPNDFYRGRKCNDRNKQIWQEANFGILCFRCNLMLPTKDRMSWLRNALDYAVEAKICE